MAYNIHWKIVFKSLRAATTYTVNIYKDGTVPTGYPLKLKGGAEPFTTEEDASEDMFTPIRTQTGYLRIVDDGYAVNASNATVAWDWKELLPENNTDRPVTLTNASGTVVWCGFMQAQNFGGTLFGNPQEREYPLMCPLSICEDTFINTSQKAIKNFAYLLKTAIDSIPALCQPTAIEIQGGANAQGWLLKKIDWYNFVNIDASDELSPKYNMLQCLEDMCRFWGWTARMKARTLYLTCADDAAEVNVLRLTYAQLSTLADGDDAGIVGTMFSTVTLSGAIYASNANEDSMIRGYNKATVKADCNKADDEVTGFMPMSVEKYLIGLEPTSETYGGKNVDWYGDLAGFPNTSLGIKSPLLTGWSLTGNASFSYVSTEQVKGNCIRIKKSYSNDNVYASLETQFEHNWCTDFYTTGIDNGGFQIRGNIYQGPSRLNEYVEGSPSMDSMGWSGCGKKSMYIRFGIGSDRGSAKWFNGNSWQATTCSFKVTVGNEDDILRPIGGLTLPSIKHISCASDAPLEGRIFIDFLGSDDLYPILRPTALEREFYITGFRIDFSKSKDFENTDGVTRDETQTEMYYVVNNSARTGQEWSTDCAYASENNMKHGYGVLINPNGTLMDTAYYGNSSEHPEQHLAGRVANYWATSKRRIYAELQSNAIADINPRNKTTMDGTPLYPIAISRNWRDDISRITFLQI